MHASLFSFITLCLAVFLGAGAWCADGPSVTVLDKPLNPVDPRLFGQFMERASWGEPGPETSVREDGSLPPKVITLLKGMKIPVIRFPGGSDISHIDWNDMISNVPGRGEERPVTKRENGNTITNRFGYDEYFRVRNELGCETILVVNLLDALKRRKPLREAALHAAGLVAYCNAPQGAKLPEGMPDWPAVRAKNGHPEPFKVEYFQIGNETWFFPKGLKKLEGLETDEALGDWYAECILEYARLMRQVDPKIKIIMDARIGKDDLNEAFYKHADALRDVIDFAALHHYKPMHVKEVKKNRDVVAPDDMTAEDWWYALVSQPGNVDENGLNMAHREWIDLPVKHGFPVATTEWNWNGWGMHDYSKATGVGNDLASGLGAASFIHGMIRQGAHIRIANQSMLLGGSWDITAVRTPEDGSEPYYYPQGLATTFYSLHHGETRLDVKCANVATYEQPYRFGGAWPAKVMPMQDIIATGNDNAVFVHVVNREFENPVPLTVDLSALGAFASDATQHLFLGRLNREPKKGEPVQVCRLEEKPLTIPGPVFTMELPPRSISIIEVKRAE